MVGDQGEVWTKGSPTGSWVLISWQVSTHSDFRETLLSWQLGPLRLGARERHRWPDGNQEPHRIHGIHFTLRIITNSTRVQGAKMGEQQCTQRRTDSQPKKHTCTAGLKGREEMWGKGDRRDNEGKCHPRFSSEKVAFPGIDELSNDPKLNMPGKLPVCSLELTSRLTSCCYVFPLTHLQDHFTTSLP